MTTITESVQLTVINCGRCGGTYAINEFYRAQRQENGGGWHCPYCDCTWGFFGKTDNQLLKERLDASKRELEETQARLRAEKCLALNNAALRAKAERKLARVNRGVCPCCNRSFQNLKNHMRTKHPESRE